MKSTWTMQKVWNESLENRAERPIEPRQKIWASELGKADIEIYLKLIGETPTNYPNARARRKFEAGNIWEWIIKLVLMRAGVYRESQTPVSYAESNLNLEVSGKLDHIAGGKVDIEQAESAIDSLEMPELFTRASKAIIEYFVKEYPNGLDEKIIEVKSVSSFAFDAIESTNKALAGHDLQLFHYCYNLKKEGAIVYICRDDARMYEIPILPNDVKLLSRYTEKIARVTSFYRARKEPEKEPAIIFDEEVGKFRKNFNAEYSMFLTRLYGFKDQSEFDDTYGGLSERWNRVLGRLKEGKDMTANNLDAIAEMGVHGYDIETIKSKILKK